MRCRVALTEGKTFDPGTALDGTAYLGEDRSPPTGFMLCAQLICLGQNRFMSLGPERDWRTGMTQLQNGLRGK